ncbi:hypothetical protein D3C73_440800 [compost metagenome]
MEMIRKNHNKHNPYPENRQRLCDKDPNIDQVINKGVLLISGNYPGCHTDYDRNQNGGYR